MFCVGRCFQRLFVAGGRTLLAPLLIMKIIFRWSRGRLERSLRRHEVGSFITSDFGEECWTSGRYGGTANRSPLIVALVDQEARWSPEVHYWFRCSS